MGGGEREGGEGGGEMRGRGIIYISLSDSLILSSDHFPSYTSLVLKVNTPSPCLSSSTQSPWKQPIR